MWVFIFLCILWASSLSPADTFSHTGESSLLSSKDWVYVLGTQWQGFGGALGTPEPTRHRRSHPCPMSGAVVTLRVISDVCPIRPRPVCPWSHTQTARLFEAPSVPTLCALVPAPTPLPAPGPPRGVDPGLHKAIWQFAYAPMMNSGTNLEAQKHKHLWGLSNHYSYYFEQTLPNSIFFFRGRKGIQDSY